jgi:hypothetical protein
MKRPTERQAAAIEAKIECLRAAATAALYRDQFGRANALNAEADALQREYVEACGVSAIIKRQLLGSLAVTPEVRV